MKQLDFSFQEAWGGCYIAISVNQLTHFNEKHLEQIRNNLPEFVFSCVISNQPQPTLLYRLQTNIESLQYTNMNCRRGEAIAMIGNILRAIMNTGSFYLDYHKLYMDLKCIYINRATCQPVFVYIPDEDFFTTDSDIIQLLQTLIGRLIIAEDPGLKAQLLQLFQTNSTLIDVYQGFMRMCSQPKMPKIGQYKFKLVHSALPEVPDEICLGGKDQILIGRYSEQEAIQPEVLFPKSCKAIGRKHAQITKINNEYYITDLNSVNHTYLDGLPMEPNVPYKLVPGCEICFTMSQPVRYRLIFE